MNWPLGLVTDLFPGRDGVVRCVNLQTAKGVLRRPVQKLHDLEIYYDMSNNNEQSHVPYDNHVRFDNEVDEEGAGGNKETENVAQVSRSGRTIKPRSLLDL